MSRDGFTLAEVVVALLLLSVGVLAEVGALGAATRVLDAAELEERAALLGATVADSLAQVQERGGAAVAGERRNGLLLARWTPRPDGGYTVSVLGATAAARARAGAPLHLLVQTPRLPTLPDRAGVP